MALLNVAGVVGGSSRPQLLRAPPPRAPPAAPPPLGGRRGRAGPRGRPPAPSSTSAPAALSPRPPAAPVPRRRRGGPAGTGASGGRGRRGGRAWSRTERVEGGGGRSEGRRERGAARGNEAPLPAGRGAGPRADRWAKLGRNFNPPSEVRAARTAARAAAERRRRRAGKRGRRPRGAGAGGAGPGAPGAARPAPRPARSRRPGPRAPSESGGQSWRNLAAERVLGSARGAGSGSRSRRRPVAAAPRTAAASLGPAPSAGRARPARRPKQLLPALDPPRLGLSGKPPRGWSLTRVRARITVPRCPLPHWPASPHTARHRGPASHARRSDRIPRWESQVPGVGRAPLVNLPVFTPPPTVDPSSASFLGSGEALNLLVPACLGGQRSLPSLGARRAPACCLGRGACRCVPSGAAPTTASSKSDSYRHRRVTLGQVTPQSLSFHIREMGV